jgi:enamine deaminase RidA (YjgF/YER057c/UK114 family)
MKKLISSGSEFELRMGYSRAVVDDNYVFVSGCTGFDYQSMSISDQVIEQAEQCFQNIDSALIKAGSAMSEVVRVRYIFSDRNDFEPCWPVLEKYFGAVRPAATMIVAGLFDSRMKLEIEVTARIA